VAFRTVKTGEFPHQMYVADCDCPEGKPVPTVNYQKHPIAPPTCSSCKRSYRLDTGLLQKQN
jgi:hypothetical protein